MNLLGALLGGSIGAAIGGIVWGLIAHFAHVEIGWIAWGVGLLAGAGASIGAKGEGGPAAGGIAAILAVASILIAKYVVVQTMVGEGMAEIQAQVAGQAMPETSDGEFWISYVADQLIEQKEKAGETIAWPAGSPGANQSAGARGGDDDESAYPEHEADYPKAIWADAKARWVAMTPEDKADFRRVADENTSQQIQSMLADIGSHAANEGFMESFGAMDLLFGALAIITAFKVGSGSVPGTENA